MLIKAGPSAASMLPKLASQDHQASLNLQGSVLAPVDHAETSAMRSPANPMELAARLTSKASRSVQNPDFRLDIATIKISDSVESN